MKVAEYFIGQGHAKSAVLSHCGLSHSNYSYRPIGMHASKHRGPKASTHTAVAGGGLVPNGLVCTQIEELLGGEFIDYGYLKVTYCLRKKYNYLISAKKVYRLMKENKLVLPKPKTVKTGRKWVEDLLPQADTEFGYWEFDIKYIYIHGCSKWAYLLSVLDVNSRWLMGWTLQWSITKKDVVALFDAILSDYSLPSRVRSRCDNGSQFACAEVQEYLRKKGVEQEFTKPATPEQNAHIESYHSVLERAVCRRFEMESLMQAQALFARWEQFYNGERIHSGVGYKSPKEYLLSRGIQMKNGEPLQGGKTNTKLQQLEEELEVA